MTTLFYVASTIAIASTVMVITRTHAVHALLYLVVSFLAMALVFFSFGAAFAAALEVIIYAGAIIVVFVFVVMLLSPGREGVEDERLVIAPGAWIGPGTLAAILLVELVIALGRAPDVARVTAAAPLEPKQIGAALFGPYLIAVELASFLLLAGLIGACHIGRRTARRYVAPADGPPAPAAPAAPAAQVGTGGEA